MSGAAGPVDQEAVPAATVVVLRDGASGLEVLMLRRDPKAGAFADMWVFPGGRIDPGDADPEHPDDEQAAARRAAVREAKEEAGLDVDPGALVPFAHWRPPPETPRRFSTWFFMAPAPLTHEVEIDGVEIHDHAWLRPADVLAGRDAGTMELAPPTWVTLWQLVPAHDMEDAFSAAMGRDLRRYETRIVKQGGVLVALWAGDAGYDDRDPDRPGPRHRLLMDRAGWRFEEH